MDAPSLSPGNSAFAEAIKSALGAIFLLDQANVTVRDIDVRSGKPVLRIDRPPAFVQGTACVRRSHPALIETIYVAPFRGCQLEWVERAPRAPSVAMGGAA